MKFADIILPLSIQDWFTYSIPPEMEECLQEGCRVEVPFGKKKTYIGIVKEIHDQQPPGHVVKPIIRCVDAERVVTPSQMQFWNWIAQYYICNLGEVMNAALPAGLKDDTFRPKIATFVKLAGELDPSKKELVVSFLKKSAKQQILFEAYLEMSDFGRREPLLPVRKSELLHSCNATSAAFNGLVEKKLLATYEQEVERLPMQDIIPQPLNPLNVAQQKAYDEINECFLTKDVTLLHGVTSSGKTEIYTHLIQKTIDEGKQVLYLLPEIALTTQITDRLRRVFGSQMGVYHSKFTDSVRGDVYRKQLSGQPYNLILGVRSSVFLPFSRLGLIIVDEEHETSYKQQEPAPRYHARSGAVILASQNHAKVLLGTATPSLETYQLAKSGKYGYVNLTTRFRDMQLPEINVVDIKRLKFQKRMKGVFSTTLLDAIGEALERREQVILFQNRRGYSNSIMCKTCGWVPKCEHCDVSLTYHKRTQQLLCHYCGAAYELPERCPQCETESFMDLGAGTEKVEAQIHKYFPAATTVRMDVDTARTRVAYEQIINDFAHHRYDILIGTQMVAKGLDFDGVSVVGILDADAMLNLPDFRIQERTYHMLAQVAGRAGRKNRNGKVILQTRSADSPLIACVVNNDYEEMFSMLMEERKLFHYPPYFRLINVYLRHRDSKRVELLAHDLSSLLRQVFADRVLGPDKPMVSRVNSLFIRKLMIKIEKNASPVKVRAIMFQIQERLMQQPSANGLQVYYDVDPMN